MTTKNQTDFGIPVAPRHTKLTPVSLGNVQITGGYWHEKQRINGDVSIRHAEEWIEKVGWIGNFDAAQEGRLPQDRTGREFSDSDVYKLMEAMAWEIGRTGDAGMEQRFQRLVERIAPVQEEDGYINTKFGRPGQGARYSDLQWGHELYTFGHLIQAGIARGRTHGEDRFVSVARRAADHVCATFGEDGNRGVCGHPEIEVALAEFSRYTGDRKYLEQALRFIERRGHGVLGDIEFGASYFQDDKAVRETTVMSGHAVRALYLAAGAIDAAVDSEDKALLDALIEQVAATTARRTYITGGMGAHHEGESFGQDYELPPDRAYSETCAGVASVMVNYRLLLATGEPRYADLMERTLYNVIAASPAQDGKAFFYTNTLHQREEGHAPSHSHASPRAASSLRAPWFEVSCCPTNVARTLSSLGALMATTTEDGVQIHQYATSTLTAELSAGRVQLQVTTDYPASGKIKIEILESPDQAWELAMRVPSWAADGATITVGEQSHTAHTGMANVGRIFAPGDLIELTLPVEPRWTRPDPRVDAIRGTVAVERGPQVLCVESTNSPGHSANDARIDTRAPLIEVDGVTTAQLAFVELEPVSWPYADRTVYEAPLSQSLRVPLYPYASWANRGPSTMRVWIPETQAALQGSTMN